MDGHDKYRLHLLTLGHKILLILVTYEGFSNQTYFPITYLKIESCYNWRAYFIVKKYYLIHI